RGGGRALEGVGVHLAGGGQLLDVAMRIAAAGQHQLAACVDLLLPLVEAVCDRCDLVAADADIGLEAVSCGRDRSAADDEIEGLHDELPVSRPTRAVSTEADPHSAHARESGNPLLRQRTGSPLARARAERS